MPHDPPPSPTAASAARRATEDPGVFLIPQDALPPGFAERVEGSGWTPVPPRPAATVVLLRETEGGPEVLLLRRHRRSGFAADAWVFPGGTVDAEDRDPALAGALSGPSAAEWAARMGLADAGEALGYVAASIREALEETGILLAFPAPPADVVAEARRALLAGETTLARVVEEIGARLDGAGLVYVAHWITPDPEPRRYDTRFFLAQVPADAVCAPHQAELVDFAWMPPARAVERFRDGGLRLLPPTVRTLEDLSGFASVHDLRVALRDRPVPAILPRMRRHPDGVAIELPRRAPSEP